MTKLHIGFMRELRNYQFAVLINEIASSLSKVEITEQPLKHVIDKIQGHSKEMYYLEDQTPCHPLTEVIGELTRMRTNYLISLRMQVEGKMLSNKKHEHKPAGILNNWLQNNKKYLYVASIIPQNGQIRELLAGKNLYPIIQQSLVDLGLDDLLESIVEVTDEIYKQDKKRVNSKIKETKNGKALRCAAYSDIHLLVNTLDVMMGVHPEETPENIYFYILCKVKQQLKSSHTVLKSKNTKRENKKNLASAVAKLVRSTNGKEKAVIPNKKLSEIISEEYVRKESKTLLYSLAEAEDEVKRTLLIRDGKRKVPIGKNWRWKLPQIGVN